MENNKTLEEILKEMDIPVEKEEKVPYDINPVIRVCPKCGVEWRSIMYYSCNRTNCPIQTKVML